MSDGTGGTLWERNRRAAREHIVRVAIRLFLEQGFGETTTEQIAREAGVSPRSFFRYFATKEDLLLGGLAEQGPAIRAALEARPDSEGPWEALTEALATVQPLGDTRDEVLAIGRMLHETPSLRARSIEKHLGWQELLVPDIRRRLGIPPDDDRDPRADAIVASALACIDVVGEIWGRGGGRDDLRELWERALAAIRS